MAGAIANLRQGIRHVDFAQEPRLELVAKHNLVKYLYQVGRYHQAIALLPEARELHRALGSELDSVRFRWLEGVIVRDSGDLEYAERILEETRSYFVEKRIAHDAALVSLDIAAIYMRQRRTIELKRLAGEMLAIFHALRINREAVAALVLFQKAIEAERATLGLVRDLAAYLKISRHDPRLPFRPSVAN
jgi:tetratricopeptide (TPR) repeat protein